MTQTIRVICDRCGAAGVAGGADFSDLGDLLSFAAVPRQCKRKDGWSPVMQREFIARLAQTASPQLAVDAMGKNLYGVKKLLKDPGSDGFRDAWERAVEIGEGVEARRRIAEQAGLHQRSAHLSGGSARSRRHEPAPEHDGEDSPAIRMELVERLVAKWQRKLGQERESRIAGEVAAADFYLRQVTCLEVAFDLMVEGHGFEPWSMLMEVRRGGRNLLEIADTYMARVLDQARRDHWAAMAEPDRPLLWPERYLIGDASTADERTEPLHALGKASQPAAGYSDEAWSRLSVDEQREVFAEQHAEDAADQVLWEASARIEAAEWRAKQSTEDKPDDGEDDDPA